MKFYLKSFFKKASLGLKVSCDTNFSNTPTLTYTCGKFKHHYFLISKAIQAFKTLLNKNYFKFTNNKKLYYKSLYSFVFQILK